MNLNATYTSDATSESLTLAGNTLQALADQVPEELGEVEITVYDDHGFVRGWILGHGKWQSN